MLALDIRGVSRSTTVLYSVSWITNCILTNTLYSLHIAPSLEEENRFLTSVITALDKKDELKDSFAMAQARAMRATANLKTSHYKEAIEDAQCAVELDPTNDKAWRTLTDAHEASGNVQGAVEALQCWSKARPTFSKKANKEIQRLKEL